MGGAHARSRVRAQVQGPVRGDRGTDRGAASPASPRWSGRPCGRSQDDLGAEVKQRRRRHGRPRGRGTPCGQRSATPEEARAAHTQFAAKTRRPRRSSSAGTRTLSLNSGAIAPKSAKFRRASRRLTEFAPLAYSGSRTWESSSSQKQTGQISNVPGGSWPRVTYPQHGHGNFDVPITAPASASTPTLPLGEIAFLSVLRLCPRRTRSFPRCNGGCRHSHGPRLGRPHQSRDSADPAHAVGMPSL
jgi:hypothetical protein